MPGGLFCLNSLDWSISNRRGVWLPVFVEIFKFKANSVCQIRRRVLRRLI